METQLGGLMADMLAESLGLDIVLLGSGNIRTRELGPLVTYQNLTECYPYDNSMHMIKVTGAQLKTMMQFMLRDNVWHGEHCEFYQLSKALKIVYNISHKQFIEFSFNGEPISENDIFTIGLEDCHLSNFEEFFNVPVKEIEKNTMPIKISTSVRDILEEYLTEHQHLDKEIDGRLTLITT